MSPIRSKKGSLNYSWVRTGMEIVVSPINGRRRNEKFSHLINQPNFHLVSNKGGGTEFSENERTLRVFIPNDGVLGVVIQ